jgi:hypothetical protein
VKVQLQIFLDLVPRVTGNNDLFALLVLIAPSISRFSTPFGELVQGIVSFPNLLEPLTSTQFVLSKQQHVQNLSNIKIKSKQFKYTSEIIWNKCLLQSVKGVSNKIRSQIVIGKWQLLLHFPLEDAK